MKAVEASAPTREQAIQNALQELGVEMYQVDKIEILDEGSRGLFGFGARPVKVKVVVENLPDEPRRKAPRPQEAAPEPAAEARNEGDRPRPPHQNRGRDRQDRPDRPARQDRGDRPDRGSRPAGTAVQEHGGGQRGPKHAPNKDDAAPREQRTDRGPERGRERGPRGNERSRGQERNSQPGNDRNRERGRDRAQEPREHGAQPAHEPVAEGAEQRQPRQQPRHRPPRPERDRNREHDNRPPRRPHPAERPVSSAAPEDVDAELMEGVEETGAMEPRSSRSEEESFAPLTDEQGQQAAVILQEIITRMGITAQVAFGRGEDGSARANVNSEDSAILIGRKGRTLSSLQYLVNRMISDAESENTERLVVDVEGYVDRRQASLEEMAKNLAEKAKATQRNMRLKPLSPQERRIIHLTLQDDPEVRTFSIGESLFRSVIISPKNARPERSRPPRSRGGRGGRNRRGGHRQDGELDAGQFGD